MNKLLMYSQDTVGMGNIRRMLALGEYLLEANSELSILLITGSPAIDNLQLPRRLDYIKLPSITRFASEPYSPKAAGKDVDELLRLRGDLILAAASNFDPQLVLVDEQPAGMGGELGKALGYLKLCSNARLVLILRDILDSPENAIPAWKQQGHSAPLASFYDKVLVLGTPDIFNPLIEYRLPPEVASRTTFCGYLGKRTCHSNRSLIRQQLGVAGDERLILVMPGGGEDGQKIFKTYCAALSQIESRSKTRSLIVPGPEMPESEQQVLAEGIT